VTSGREVFVVETTISPAITRLVITSQMLEVQLDHTRIIKISRKVVSGARQMSAHADDGSPNLPRQTIDAFRIPGIVVANLTGASEYGCWTPK
jgi:hypothetical protein